MRPLKPQHFPPCASGADEALVRRLIHELPKYVYAQMEEKVTRAIYRHYKGGWYEVLYDPAVHAGTFETFTVYKQLGTQVNATLARHTETDERFTIDFSAVHHTPTLRPTSIDLAAVPQIGLTPLWARPRAMFHGVLPDGRHRFVRRTTSVAEIVEGITRANAHLTKAREHLESDDPMAASHAAAEIRNAQRVLEQGEPK